MDAWKWTIFNLLSFPYDNTMIRLARIYPNTSDDDLSYEAKRIIIERGFASLYD